MTVGWPDTRKWSHLCPQTVCHSVNAGASGHGPIYERDTFIFGRFPIAAWIKWKFRAESSCIVTYTVISRPKIICRSTSRPICTVVNNLFAMIFLEYRIWKSSVVGISELLDL